MTKPASPWHSRELYILLALSLLIRCWRLYQPDAVVWDEIHYERFAGAYFSHMNYVDVHPPLSKMLIAWFGVLFGAAPGDFINIRPAPEARILPAVLGALVVPIVFLILRELGAGTRTAVFAGALLLVDNALVIESRLILTDGMLLFFGFAALLTYLCSRRAASWRRWMLVCLAALFAGAAFSTKWTGLSMLGLLFVIWMIDTLTELRARRSLVPKLVEAMALVAIPLAVYIGTFAVHFSLLTKVGGNDYLLSQEFKSTLIGNVNYKAHDAMSLLAKTKEINVVMQRVNERWTTNSNPGASPWYTWPIAKHSIGFWLYLIPGSTSIQWILLFGNPVVWLGTLGLMLIVAVQWARRDTQLTQHHFALAILAVGYLANFLPFAPIKRPMYLYHYFFALTFSVMFAALGLGALLRWDDPSGPAGSWKSWRMSAWLVLVVGSAALFLYMAPLTYGTRLEPDAVSHRQRVIERRL